MIGIERRSRPKLPRTYRVVTWDEYQWYRLRKEDLINYADIASGIVYIEVQPGSFENPNVTDLYLSGGSFI